MPGECGCVHEVESIIRIRITTVKPEWKEFYPEFKRRFYTFPIDLASLRRFSFPLHPLGPLAPLPLGAYSSYCTRKTTLSRLVSPVWPRPAALTFDSVSNHTSSDRARSTSPVTEFAGMQAHTGVETPFSAGGTVADSRPPHMRPHLAYTDQPPTRYVSNFSSGMVGANPTANSAANSATGQPMQRPPQETATAVGTGLSPQRTSHIRTAQHMYQDGKLNMSTVSHASAPPSVSQPSAGTQGQNPQTAATTSTGLAASLPSSVQVTNTAGGVPNDQPHGRTNDYPRARQLIPLEDEEAAALYGTALVASAHARAAADMQIGVLLDELTAMRHRVATYDQRFEKIDARLRLHDDMLTLIKQQAEERSEAQNSRIDLALKRILKAESTLSVLQTSVATLEDLAAQQVSSAHHAASLAEGLAGALLSIERLEGKLGTLTEQLESLRQARELETQTKQDLFAPKIEQALSTSSRAETTAKEAAKSVVKIRGDLEQCLVQLREWHEVLSDRMTVAEKTAEKVAEQAAATAAESAAERAAGKVSDKLEQRITGLLAQARAAAAQSATKIMHQKLPQVLDETKAMVSERMLAQTTSFDTKLNVLSKRLRRLQDIIGDDMQPQHEEAPARIRDAAGAAVQARELSDSSSSDGVMFRTPRRSGPGVVSTNIRSSPPHSRSSPSSRPQPLGSNAGSRSTNPQQAGWKIIQLAVAAAKDAAAETASKISAEVATATATSTATSVASKVATKVAAKLPSQQSQPSQIPVVSTLHPAVTPSTQDLDASIKNAIRQALESESSDSRLAIVNLIRSITAQLEAELKSLQPNLMELKADVKVQRSELEQKLAAHERALDSLKAAVQGIPELSVTLSNLSNTTKDLAKATEQTQVVVSKLEARVDSIQHNASVETGGNVSALSQVLSKLDQISNMSRQSIIRVSTPTERASPTLAPATGKPISSSSVDNTAASDPNHVMISQTELAAIHHAHQQLINSQELLGLAHSRLVTEVEHIANSIERRCTEVVNRATDSIVSRTVQAASASTAQVVDNLRADFDTQLKTFIESITNWRDAWMLEQEAKLQSAFDGAKNPSEVLQGALEQLDKRVQSLDARVQGNSHGLETLASGLNTLRASLLELAGRVVGDEASILQLKTDLDALVNDCAAQLLKLRTDVTANTDQISALGASVQSNSAALVNAERAAAEMDENLSVIRRRLRACVRWINYQTMAKGQEGKGKDMSESDAAELNETLGLGSSSVMDPKTLDTTALFENSASVGIESGGGRSTATTTTRSVGWAPNLVQPTPERVRQLAAAAAGAGVDSEVEGEHES